MILYIDETENEKYFIVCALAFKNEQKTNNIYKSFKKNIRRYPINRKDKVNLYMEFKSVLLDRRYRRIKKEMLKMISQSESIIAYAVYKKKEPKLKQSNKEKIYVRLLEELIKGLNIKVDMFTVNLKNMILKNQ